jgi:DUF2975 family protein
VINESRAVAALRVFLVVLFAVLVLLQVMSLPGQFAHMAAQNPEMAHLRWPATVVSIFWVLCVQVVIVAAWKLLTLVKRDRIFTEASMVWVDAIVWAVGAAWAVLVGVLGYVGATSDGPGNVLMVFLLVVGVSVVGLVVVVLRALLRRAAALRSDLEAVI